MNAQAQSAAAKLTRREGDQICGAIHQMLIHLRSTSRGENPVPANKSHRKDAA